MKIRVDLGKTAFEDGEAGFKLSKFIGRFFPALFSQGGCDGLALLLFDRARFAVPDVECAPDRKTRAPRRPLNGDHDLVVARDGRGEFLKIEC